MNDLEIRIREGQSPLFIDKRSLWSNQADIIYHCVRDALVLDTFKVNRIFLWISRRIL